MDSLEQLRGLTESVIGAAIEVHRVQANVVVRYKDLPVGDVRLDILVAGRLILELKAVEAYAPVHIAQLLSYLKATRLPLGLLINFNVRVLRHGIRRVVWTHPHPSALSSPSLRLCSEKQADGVDD